MNKTTNIVNISLIILQNTKKRFLLLERPENVHCPSCWSFPGGKVKQTETALQAAQRELKEETAILANAWESLGCFEYDYPKAPFYFHLFHAHIPHQQAVKSAEKHIWVPANALRNFNMPEANQQFLTLVEQLE